MTTTARPAWVEDLNTIGTNLGGAPHVVDLDADSLVEEAATSTGLSDFGEDSWREPFGILLDAIEEHANLNLVGRLLTRSEILRALQNRLRIVDAWKRHPEILEEPIERPIVITGTGRSGTSILHELMAQDPRNRSPLAWEVMYSVPPPESASYATDPRIERADRELTLWHEITPEYKTMHENGGALPFECIFLMIHEFASPHFSGVLNVPPYAAWLATQDLTPAFRFHRRQLQLLQWRCPGSPWLLKAPSHLTMLPTLFSVYPDARLVLTHRDPVKTVASIVSLVATLRRMRSDHVDVEPLVRQYTEGIALGLESVIAQRKSGVIPDDQIVDLRFRDLMADPTGTLQSVYAQLGLDLPADIATRMKSYVDAKPRGKHGAHRYSLEDYGIDPAWVHERYATYLEEYGVEAETA